MGMSLGASLEAQICHAWVSMSGHQQNLTINLSTYQTHTNTKTGTQGGEKTTLENFNFTDETINYV